MPDKPTKTYFAAIKVTVIDDDASVRNGISRLARSHDFICTTFESGESAVAAPSIGETDCLILDIQLSGMDGFETRDRLEALGLQLPVVFITGHAEIKSPEWQRQLKGSPCLSKPFEAGDLIEAIHRILETRAR